MLNSILLVLICIGICLTHRGPNRKIYEREIKLLWPSTVVVVGIMLRIGIGGWLVWLFRDMQLKDEFRLYKISVGYLDQKMLGWIILVSASLTFYCIARYAARRIGSRVCIKKGSMRSNEAKNRSGDLTSLLLMIGILACFGLINSVQGVVLGTHDRGHQYLSWIGEAWSRPDSWIQSVIKLKYLYFLLLPFVWKRCSKGLVAVLTLPAGIMCGLSLVAGARGDALYPVTFMLLGLLMTGDVTWKRTAGIVFAGVLVVGLGAPILEGIRDTKRFQDTELSNLKERVSGIAMNVEEITQKAKIRAPQIGRQLYACSDGYLFEKKTGETGWNDMGHTVIRAFPPLRSLIKIITGTGFDSAFDGADIAQSAMGTDIRGWYPCVTLMGDSFRRSGYIGVWITGSVLGVIMFVIDAVWSILVSKVRPTLGAMVYGLLPVLYLQTFPLGTVSETLWWLSWDSLKYTLLCLVLVAGCERLATIWNHVDSK